MSDYLIGLRTTKLDIQTLSLYAFYKNSNIDVVLVIDELKQKVDCGVFPKVSINKDVLKSADLYIGEDRLGWLCGDFGLYLMAQHYPQYKGYWLIEDDAFVTSPHLAVYLGLPMLKGLDLCAKSFWNAHQNWQWKASAEAYFNVPVAKKMSFGVVYVSREFCLKAKEKRIEYIKQFQNNSEAIFLNDESFIANFSQGFQTAQMEKLYGEEDLKNFHFTTSNQLFNCSLTFDNLKQGFYHPIIVNASPQDTQLRMLHILKKQKRFGRHYRNTMAKMIESQQQLLDKEFSPKVLIGIIYQGSEHLERLGKTIQSRWIEYVVINLTQEELHLDGVDVFHVNGVNEGLTAIEQTYYNHDGIWLIPDIAQIGLDTNKSLAKYLEIPERQKINFGYLETTAKNTLNKIYYMNFGYLLTHGFQLDQAVNLTDYYDVAFIE